MFELFKKKEKMESASQPDPVYFSGARVSVALFDSPQANLMYQELCFRFIDEKPDDVEPICAFEWMQLVKDIRKIDDDIVSKMKTADNAEELK